MIDKCSKCNMPLEDEDTRCLCNDAICVHCCECDPGCGCSCKPEA